jgi:hypothetical protein
MGINYNSIFLDHGFGTETSQGPHLKLEPMTATESAAPPSIIATNSSLSASEFTAP